MTEKNLLKTLRWLALPILLFGLTNLQAQSYVSSDEAMVKLELKLADIYKNAEAGAVLLIDREIAEKFISEAAWEITTKKPIAVALNNAFEATKRKYALYYSNVSSIKDSITNLLEIK